jgi:archaellum component FlaC
MYNYGIFDAGYEDACDRIDEIESEVLVCDGISDMLEELEERTDEIMHELDGINRALCELRDKYEQISEKRR